MTLHFHLVPIMSIVAGVVILVVPKILNYVIAVYLIVAGLVGLGVVQL